MPPVGELGEGVGEMCAPCRWIGGGGGRTERDECENFKQSRLVFSKQNWADQRILRY